MSRHALAVVPLLLAAWVAAAASGLPDRLDLAATRSAFVLESTQLDIERAGERLVTVGDYGIALYSDDNGATWRQGEVPVQVMLTAVDFVDAQYGWAVGHDAVILHTQDGGETWTRQLDGRQTGELLLAGATTWQADVQARVNAAGDDADEGLLLESDAAQMAAAEAEREVEVGPNRPFLDVLFLDRSHGFAVGAFGYFFETRDGGATWRDASAQVPNYDALHLYSMTALDADNLVLVGEFGLALQSQDRGKSWRPLDLGYEGTLFKVFARKSDVWIVGLRGHAFHSPDDGGKWQLVSVASQSSLLGGTALSQTGAVLVGLGGLILETRGAGTEPEFRSSGGRAHLAAVAVAADGGLVFVGEEGIGRLAADNGRLPVSYDSELVP
jgi:photosystem II stability/assembly factor-like uncharacterized protein